LGGKASDEGSQAVAAYIAYMTRQMSLRFHRKRIHNRGPSGIDSLKDESGIVNRSVQEIHPYGFGPYSVVSFYRQDIPEKLREREAVPPSLKPTTR